MTQLINKLILGTVQFGMNYGINNTTGKPSRELVFDILNEAYDRGIRILDTAEAYGDAHELIGDFHRSNPSKKFEIISKIPHEFDGDIGNKVQQYTKELTVSHLKALLFHSYDSYKRFTSLLSRENRNQIIVENVETLGVSIYTNEHFGEVLEDEMIGIIQLPFNLFDNNKLRGELIEKAKHKGKKIHTRSVFLQGLFFVDGEHKVALALHRELSLVKEIAKELNISLSALALSYCVQQKNIDNVLIGVETKEQINQNIKELYTYIPLGYLEKIESIFIENLDVLNPSKWN